LTRVSIVIPALNDSASLQLSLAAIIRETTGSDAEIIVVDNGSSDDTPVVAQTFGARVLLEHQNPGSPYSARNRGIEASSGEVVILLDATCVPQPGWLKAGLSALGDLGGIVGGHVRFSFKGNRPTAAEAFDAMIHIQMEREITLHQRAMTANLFIRRDVFSRQGLFREGIRSGEDVRWTANAARTGERLDYSAEAVVCKPARDWADLLHKVKRTARGAPAILGRRRSLLAVLKGMATPPNPRLISKSLQRSFPDEAPGLFWPVFLVAWRLRWHRAWGLFRAVLGRP
jgi:glycosyltransferase involved in cell wall biosynthesis